MNKNKRDGYIQERKREVYSRIDPDDQLKDLLCEAIVQLQSISENVMVMNQTLKNLKDD